MIAEKAETSRIINIKFLNVRGLEIKLMTRERERQREKI